MGDLRSSLCLRRPAPSSVGRREQSVPELSAADSHPSPEAHPRHRQATDNSRGLSWTFGLGVRTEATEDTVGRQSPRQDGCAQGPTRRPYPQLREAGQAHVLRDALRSQPAPGPPEGPALRTWFCPHVPTGWREVNRPGCWAWQIPVCTQAGPILATHHPLRVPGTGWGRGNLGERLSGDAGQVTSGAG